MMSALDNGSNPSESSSDLRLAASLTTTNLQGQEIDSKKSTKLYRRMRIYTRSQLLFLNDSPLVHPPPNMPDLKQWFGTENEANFNKKEAELSTPGSARERRHPKRDVDEGETTARQTFRPTLSQPSQMGNFKHQSLRASDRERDRERDREGERDRDRDLRDKEGQERLRHLSDKYDRDRLSLPVAGVRGKEREAAPHLGTGSTSRMGMQPQASNAASRRAETREAAKKKAGEASEDWRRGAEPPRTGRDDRPEGRKERDERARSKARDTSRPRRDPSSSRRERDKEREDGREKDKPPRGERERDDYRRERDDHRRDRDRELDKDIDQDDPRRWRDDGKREERIAARRGDRPSDRDRVRDKPTQDSGTDPMGDRRWASGEDRDGRYKRSSVRDRKSGAMNDETNERDDRREREREKEPAWMNTYIPSDSSGGILGAGAADGELDGIQEWKKGLKEKETKGKIHSVIQDMTNVDDTNHPVASDMTESHLDEIQLFKLMMKREEERKKTEQDDSTTPGMQQPQQSDGFFNFHPESSEQGPLLPSSQAESIENASDTPRLLKTKDLSQRTSPAIPPPSNTDNSQARAATPSSSRPYLKLTPDLGSLISEKSPVDPATQFNPPAGSRLLAFARASAKSPVMASNTTSAQQFNGLLTQSPDGLQGQGQVKGEALRLQTGFSPFEDQPRQSYGFTEGHILDMHRHPSISERPTNALGGVGQLESVVDTNASGYAVGKGSRFAKFFDGKGREGVAPPLKVQTPLGFSSPSPNSGLRQDQGGISGMFGNVNDQRTMDDIFAMLSNSSQVNRNPLSQNTISPNNLPYGNQSNMLLLQQQQLNQQQLHPINRAESLYESRLDDRHFVPDGMVPGLRANLPRNREIGNLYSDPVDDPIQFNVQRVTQQRNLDYLGSVPQLYNQQPARLPQFRGGPSPHNQQHPLIGAQQRLQPGLANLGGRPPHEPGQFLGHPPAGMHGMLGNAPSLQQQQPPFNSFNGGSNLNFGVQQIRSPIPNHHMQTTGVPHGMGVVGHAGNMDMRQGHLLGVGIGNRAVNPSFGSQPGAGNQMQVPHAIRQQHAQQQIHPPHIMPHVPPQFQQQNHSGPNNQPAHDLMALLMGGPQRD